MSILPDLIYSKNLENGFHYTFAFFMDLLLMSFYTQLYDIFQAVVVSILLYGCTTQEFCKQNWTSLEGSTQQSSGCTTTYHPPRKLSKLDGPDMRDHCWRSRDELISDVLLWTPSHGRAKAGRPARTYTQQLCVDMGCSPEDLPEAMDDREGGERGSGITVLMLQNDDDDELFLFNTN